METNMMLWLRVRITTILLVLKLIEDQPCTQWSAEDD